MDDSLSKMIEMSFTVILFIFALSSAVFSYNRLNDNAEQMIGVNVINRRGTTADKDFDSGEINRITGASEIIFAIYDMEKAVTTGSGQYTIEVILKNGNILEMNYELEYNDVLDVDGNVVTIGTPKIYIKANGTNVPGSPFTLNESLSKSDNYGILIDEFKSYLKDLNILDSNFTISYTTGKLIFTES